MEHRLERELGQPALDVARGGGGMARQQVPEVPLPLDEVVLVREHDEGVADRGVAVRMQLHRVADHVGDLVEAPVVHPEERMEDAPLDRLQPVPQLRNRAIENEVARVLDEVILHQALELAHRWLSEHVRVERLSTMNSLRAGVFLPMKKSRLFSTSPIEPTETWTRRIPSPMN